MPIHAFPLLVTCASSLATIHQIPGAPVFSTDQAGSPSIQSSALLMCVCPITFSSHKAISRLLPLSSYFCVNSPASVRSLQPCRLRCFLDELEACFRPIHPRLRCIVSLYNLEGLLKEEAKKHRQRGIQRASTILRLHVSTLHLLHSSPKTYSCQSSKTKQECLRNL